MMIFRLIRNNGVEFMLRMPWPEPTGSPVMVPQQDGTKKNLEHKVGAIFFVPGITFKVGSGDDEESQTTPAHYEVWSMATDGCPKDEAGETRCYRIFTDEVALAEELWESPEAHAVVLSRLGDDEPDEPVETADTAPAPATVAQQAPAGNGAG